MTNEIHIYPSDEELERVRSSACARPRRLLCARKAAVGLRDRRGCAGFAARELVSSAKRVQLIAAGVLVAFDETVRDTRGECLAARLGFLSLRARGVS